MTDIAGSDRTQVKSFPWAGVAALVCLATVGVTVLGGGMLLDNYPSSGTSCSPDYGPLFLIFPMFVVIVALFTSGFVAAVFQLVRRPGPVGLVAFLLYMGVLVFWRAAVETGQVSAGTLGGAWRAAAGHVIFFAVFFVVLVAAAAPLAWVSPARRPLVWAGILAVIFTFPFLDALKRESRNQDLMQQSDEEGKAIRQQVETKAKAARERA
mgnify:FL=1